MRQLLQRHSTPAFSLVELLVCLVIVLILTSISIAAYQGSVDSSDLKVVLPKVTEDIRDYQKMAREQKAIITVDFLVGQSVIDVTIKKDTELKSRRDLKKDGILKRRLVFRKYEWPDGSETPRTWTFLPSGAVDGGTVWFGSGFAEGHLSIHQKNRIDYALN